MTRARKRFGQHFLEPAWADRVIAAIDPRAGDRFLEIGPGPGALTFRLAPRVAHLIAIEVDRDLTARLRPQLPPNVDLIEGDALEQDLAPLAALPTRVAGNLPYNISTPLLVRLVDASRVAPLLDATVMVQREVADRMRASPGGRDFGVLSVTVQLRADVRTVLTLPPGAFRPSPKVHSAVVRLTFRPPAVDVRDEAVLMTMVRALFMQRRKMLGNALGPFASTRGTTAATVLEAAGLDPRRRPETLQLAELARLAGVFASV